jgi:hypothetical protein
VTRLAGAAGILTHRSDRRWVLLTVERPRAYNTAMLSVACAICGGDAATDSMIANAALAGALSMPWLLRDKLAAVVRRLRGKSDDPDASCALPADEDDGP